MNDTMRFGHMPLPLASCIMPTAGRPQLVAQAIRYFQRQTYARKELLIAYEHPSDLPDLPDDTRIILVPTMSGASIGSKRNSAVQHAAGSIIVQWDDDDWYAERRLEIQLAPMLAGTADITALSATLFLSLPQAVCWQASAMLYRSMFVENVHGGTLAYLRRVWESGPPYPDTSLREDADFLLAAMRNGARLCRLPGQNLFVYVRHGSNSWRFAAGQYLGTADWSEVAVPPGLDLDFSLYVPAPVASVLPIMPVAVPPQETSVTGEPLVSCIMPTAQRRSFVARAIAQFLWQDYANKELLIIDNGTQPVEDLIPAGAPIRYLRLERHMSLGAKRNFACEMAQGSVVAHWDDDDWMAPGWLSSQVHTLMTNRADLCGLNKVLFHSPARQLAWKYVYDGVRPWVCGGTLCYTKAFWQRNKFPDITIGEDNAFVWSRDAKRIAVNDAMRLYIATVHDGNTSAKQTSDRRWHSFPAQEITRIQSAYSNAY